MTVPYWRLSGFYFFYFAALGSILPYWSLYLKDTGFGTVEIGQLSALLVGTKIFAPVLWGWIADHTGKSLGIIRIASMLAAVIFAGFLSVKSYIGYACITIGFSFFWNAALPQFEAATLFHLQQDPHRYSRIRLWGSIGFIAAVLGCGRFLDTQPISLLPVVIIALLFSIALVTFIVPEVRKIKYEKHAAGVMGILKKPEVAAFFIVCMLLQFAHAPYYVFYSLYLKHYHYSVTLIGGLWALGVVAEIVLFVVMRRLLARFTLRAILLLSIVSAIARWLIIAWGAEKLGLLIFAQLLHAMTFGGTHAASIHLVHRYFGLRHQGKGQALYNSSSAGLGGMLGSFYSGYYWDLLGASTIYSLSAICCTLALLIAYVWVGREKSAH